MVLARLPSFETGPEKRLSGVELKRPASVRVLEARRWRRAGRVGSIGWLGGRSPMLMSGYRKAPVCPWRPRCEEVQSLHRFCPCHEAANQGLRLRLSKIGIRMTTKNPPNSNSIWVVSITCHLSTEVARATYGDWAVLWWCSTVTNRLHLYHYMDAGSVRRAIVFACALSVVITNE
jgi:hypothetical protein